MRFEIAFGFSCEGFHGEFAEGTEDEKGVFDKEIVDGDFMWGEV